jgi:disulfide oxidoreductase YuzD
MSKRYVEIEQQMAHLEWLKAQNERAYRNTMEKTRVMHQNDIILKMSVDHNSERASWMASVIKDELSKPLVLSDAEVFEMSKRREGDSLRLNKVFS